MLPPTMSLSLGGSSQSTNVSNGHLPPPQPSTSSASAVTAPMTTTAMNGLHPNATYYPMQVFYYPTPPISPSIYYKLDICIKDLLHLYYAVSFKSSYQLF